MRLKFYSCALHLVVLTMPAFAQNSDSLRTVQLSEINVVGTRVEKKNLDTPAGITVITAEQIAESGYTSIADALSETAGIYITGVGQNPGANESIFMRGANSNQTVILVDGIRINDASTVNNTSDLSELSIANVDRIEIIRGAQSTLYGSGAVGGIVSITTKRSPKDGFHANAAVTGGTFGGKTIEAIAQASLGYRFGNGVHAAAGIENTFVDGEDATLDTVTDPSVFKNRDLDNWDKRYYYANAGLTNKAVNAEINFAATDMKTDLDKGAYLDDDNYKLNFKRTMINGNATWKTGKTFSTQLNAGFTETCRHSENDSSIVDQSGTFDHNYLENTYKGKIANAELLLNAQLKNAGILAGISCTSEDMAQEDYYYSTAFGIYETRTKLDSIDPLQLISVYLHTQLRGTALQKHLKGTFAGFMDRLSIAGGARLSTHPLTGTQYAYDLSLSIKTSESSLCYIAHSTGYNNPSLYQLYAPERYVPWDGSTATGLSRGNNQLKAENAGTFEIGFKQNQDRAFQYSISFFHSETKDLIEYVYLWNKAIAPDTLGNDPWNRDDYRGDRYLNIGKQITTGIEFEIQANLSPKLILSANASLVSGRIEYAPSAAMQAQTNGEHVQLYSNGSFVDSKSKTGSLVRRPGEATIKLIYNPVRRLHFIPSLRFVTARNDVYYDGSLGPFGALSVNVVDDYALAGLAVNLNTGYGFNVNVRMDNLLNEKYEEIHGFTTRGRSIHFTVGCTF